MDPDPGGPKHVDFVDPDSDPTDPQHCYKHKNLKTVEIYAFLIFFIL